jgi:hypothetical protein
MNEENLTTGLSPHPASASTALSPIARLADIPEEEIWLAKQKSKRTRRAYRLTPGIGQGDDITDELRFPARIADFEFQLEFEATAFLLLFLYPAPKVAL